MALTNLYIRINCDITVNVADRGVMRGQNHNWNYSSKFHKIWHMCLFLFLKNLDNCLQNQYI